MKSNIKGSVTIRISNDEMIAYIDYKPSQVLFEWSDDIILELLQTSGVKKGYKKFQFSRIFTKINSSEEESSHEIAYGLEAVSGGNAKFQFKTKDMIETLEPVYYELLESSEKPVVYAVDNEFELNEDPEQLSAVVLNHFYIDKGDVIADIDEEGKPRTGYTVAGNTLNPSADDKDLPFCISKDFKIEKGFVTALSSGFLRMGKNWIDIIPFKGHKISVIPSDDFAEYYMSFFPGSEEAPTPSYDDVLLEFKNIDYPIELLKSEEVILSAFNKAISQKKAIKYSLTKKKKAIAKIDINPSKTKAVLHLTKGAGPGEKLSLKHVGSLIRDSKIKGMNLDSLKKEILEFYKSKSLSLEYVVLEGKAATRGEPRCLKYQKEFVSVNRIEGIVERISEEQQTLYTSFKDFKKDGIESAMLVKKGFEFSFLTDPVSGDDGTDIYGNKIKGIVGNDPIIKTFENITIKKDKYIADIDGVLDLGEVSGETYLRVREHKDMFVDISVSKDVMNASFTFYKAEGSGETASIEFIKKQIDDSGIVKGIDDSIIEESFEKFNNGELISEVVFATGKVPTDKKSSKIKYFNNSGKSKFSYELEKGSSIAQIFPTKDNLEDGFDVLGTVMKSSGVVSLDLKIGDNISESKQEDESVLLIANISGELKVNDESITIVDKKILPGDVSAKTGSIKTLCSLVVKGSVNSSLYVVSGGNIKIMGTVQGALISADKNIIIAQGVKGEDKAVLRAKEKIDVKFIEKANMMAVDDIHIRKAALHTKIICNSRVLFDKNGSKIVGGETYSRKGVTVDELGSPSGGNTLISFGQDYLVADKIKVFEADIDKIQQDLMKIDQVLNRPNVRLTQEKKTHLRKQKVFLMKKLEKKNMKLFLLREKFEEHTTSEVVVRSKIYPGVIFESHGRKLEILDEEKSCKIKFNPNTGQIEKQN